MRSVLSVLSLSLVLFSGIGFSGNVWANECTDFSGTYQWSMDHGDMVETLELAQTGCERIDAKFTYINGQTFSVAFILDGRKRVITDTERMRRTESYRWNEGRTELLVDAKDEYKGSDTNYLRKGTLSLDSERNLISIMDGYNENGSPAYSSKKPYTRVK